MMQESGASAAGNRPGGSHLLGDRDVTGSKARCILVARAGVSMRTIGLWKAAQHCDRNRAVGSRCNLPGKLASAHLIRAYLCGAILIGKGSMFNVEGDRMIYRVQSVSSEVDARTETGLFVFLSGPLEFISRGKLQTRCTIDLNRVMAVGGKDHKALRMISVIRSVHAIGKYFVRSGQHPCANNGRRFSSGGGRRLCRSSEGRHAEKNKKREMSGLHAANVAINQGRHNLILLNPWLSAIYVSAWGWQKCR